MTKSIPSDYIGAGCQETGRPRILVISGIHGNESNAVAASVYAREAIENKEGYQAYCGFNFLIGFNNTGLVENVREYIDPIDCSQNDLNRGLPLDSTSLNYPDQIDRLKNHISCHDAIVDVHNSHNISNMILINADLYSNRYIKFCEKYQLPYVLRECSNPTIKNFAIRNHRFGITVELNDLGLTANGSITENVQFLLRVLKSVDSYLKEETEYRFTVFKNSDDVVPVEKISREVLSHTSGIIRFTRPGKFMDLYDRGEQIAVIVDYHDVVVERIVSPCRGYLMEIPDSYIATNGSFVGLIQPV